MDDEGRLLTSAEAGVILGVRTEVVYAIVRRGRLPIMRIGGRRLWFRLEDVMYYSETRQRAVWKEMPPDIRLWGPRDRPVEHDDLITTAEAAAILGIKAHSVRCLVRRGVLPCYQAEPCKSGVPMKIPAHYVYALNQRPSYVARRDAKLRRDVPAREYTAGWSEHNIAPVRRTGPTIACARDYGDLYTTRQAAVVLGITPLSVRGLHGRGRLHGGSREPELDAYKAARGAGHRGTGNRWLYFRKAEVHALLRDPEYMKKRAAVPVGAVA